MFRLEQAGQVIVSYCTFEILTCPFFQTSFLLHDPLNLIPKYKVKYEITIAGKSGQYEEFFSCQVETEEDFRQLIHTSRRSNTRMVKVFGNCRQLTKEDLEQKHYEME